MYIVAYYSSQSMYSGGVRKPGETLWVEAQVYECEPLAKRFTMLASVVIALVINIM